MKDILSRILWKLQELSTTKIYELYFWIIVSGAISGLSLVYIKFDYGINNIYFDIIFTLFIYYIWYKILLY